MLRDFGKRLKRTYGWNDDDFLMVRLEMTALRIPIADQHFRKPHKAYACRLFCARFCLSMYPSVFLACCSVLFLCSHHSYEIVFFLYGRPAARCDAKGGDLAGPGRLLYRCCRGLNLDLKRI